MKEDVTWDLIRKNDPNALRLVSADRSVYYAVKRIMDFVIALVLLVIFSPLLLLIALIIMLYSPGPVFFVQERVGAKRVAHGKLWYWKRANFRCYKFRTMKMNIDLSVHKAYIKALIDSDEAQMTNLQGAPTQPRKLVMDSRLIKPGKLLRKLSLDELPQLWNVLRGDMSLVGPRPAIPYEVEMYKQWHLRRLEVQPGITGLQQVAERNTKDFDQQVSLDIEYVDNQSLWLDTIIILLSPPILPPNVLLPSLAGVGMNLNSLPVGKYDSASHLEVRKNVVDSSPNLSSLPTDKYDSTSQRKENKTNAPLNTYRISVSHPKLLSLRFEAPFLFQVYTSALRSLVMKNIKKEFADQKIGEYVQQSTISVGQVIRVNFFSPDFIFSESVTKEINDGINKITFLGKPKDSCAPGMHKVLVSISDAKTNQEFESLAINVYVVDFVFDHISRPLLSRISSVFLGLGSLAMFILTFLQEIDKTFGLASGTATAVVALAVYVNFFSLYKRMLPNTP